MDHLATKGKKCKSAAVCTVCLNSIGSPGGPDDLIDCEKCGRSIHKICFKLSGGLVKIVQDFEKSYAKFPFTILCPDCRQFSHESIDKNQVVVDSYDGNGNTFKNPFEIDCIVKVIVDYLNIQDLVNIRLVNKLWNQNACTILCKESRQAVLVAYSVIRENLDLQDCLQIVQSSNQKKLMQKWSFELEAYQDQDQNRNDLKVFNQIITITSPTWVTICSNYSPLKLQENTLFPTLLTNISENVTGLSLNLQQVSGLDSAQFCMPKFPKLTSITIENMFLENYKFMKMLIENSPKLVNLTLSCRDDCDTLEGDGLTLDDYIHKSTLQCILTEKSCQNLEILKLSTTELNFDTFDMKKLHTLSLYHDYPQTLKFGRLTSVLTSLQDSLKNLKISFPIVQYVTLDEIEDLETGEMALPRLEKLEHFSLSISFVFEDKLCNIDEDPDQEIWPVKPISLAGQLPNLKKMTITYCQSWALSFETETEEQNCHRGVTQLVLKKWTNGDLTQLVGLFPQVEILNLKKFCFNTNCDGKKIYTVLGNLIGWSESLKRIEISCEYYHLENFDFGKLVCLTKLESIKISNQNPSGSGVHHFIYPNFRPLFKIATLSQVAIKSFKISKGIVEELREKYPSLDYSFYPKC